MNDKLKKILVIAAHPDDEILGCGATIAKHIEIGSTVKVIIAAEGATSRVGEINSEVREELKNLQAQSRLANEKIGVKDVSFLGLPDNRMDTLDLLDVIKKIEHEIKAFQPDIIYTHFPQDLNIDHRILAEAVLTATRPFPGNNAPSEVYFFEVASSTEWNYSGNLSKKFTPNVFVDVTKTIEKKLLALNEYKSEMREFPHARSVENVKNMALVHGACVGVNFAEAFVLARILK